uniref:Uncharacterized protein n=1 Tax=Brugia timori TaxID=42155 RepID=A0A0R3QHL3_9BILA
LLVCRTRLSFSRQFQISGLHISCDRTGQERFRPAAVGIRRRELTAEHSQGLLAIFCPDD